MMAVSAAPALAFYTPWQMPTGTSVTNTAYIKSKADATSLTGMNSIVGGSPQVESFSFWNHPAPTPATVNYINSGTASSNAGSQVGGINYTGSLTGLKTVSNYAKIYSSADAMSGTGMNSIIGSGTNTIVSGAAGSQSTSLVTDVNVTGSLAL